ncbi:putative addiction module antidote protein [Vibrio mediterranei]|jgi:probable addiction module antidote protein|nr:putative addiction module antidote protein [Vibrio mediterranei]
MSNEIDVTEYLRGLFETNDVSRISEGLGNVIKAVGATEFCRATGISRTVIYKSLSKDGNPTLKTVLSILDYCHVRFDVKIQSGKKGIFYDLDSRKSR